MSVNYRILFLGAKGLEGLSGIHRSLYNELSKQHKVVDIIDTRLNGFWKYYNILYCLNKLNINVKEFFHPIQLLHSWDVSNARMRTKYYIHKRTEQANKEIDKNMGGCDLIFQTTNIPLIKKQSQIPRVVFTSFTMKLSDREYPKWAHFLNENDKKAWFEGEKITFENASIIFTSNQHAMRSIIEDYSINANKVVTVGNGVHLEEIPNIDKKYDGKTLLFVGLEFERKGGYVLLEAFKLVREKIRGAKLLIIGETPKVYFDSEGVTFLGKLPYNELSKYFQKASIFVMPSICEPFGLVFLEAMAHKVPCVGTKVDAQPEIIEDGKTGLLAEPNNPLDLSEKLIELLKSEGLMRQMGDRGRRRVEEIFTWKLVVQRMNTEFEKILKL